MIRYLSNAEILPEKKR
ncbi:hypothetical protein CK3_31010 [butyrate-producing bacterium SS3/4]|nr:hypothetical protein CK3_31010 [butyrate-producing bacterium SS3/4]